LQLSSFRVDIEFGGDALALPLNDSNVAFEWNSTRFFALELNW
jgi:hypothetical protein